MPIPPSPSDEAAGRIAELQAAIRYWEGETESDSPERAELARAQVDRLQARLGQLRGEGFEEAGC